MKTRSATGRGSASHAASRSDILRLERRVHPHVRESVTAGLLWPNTYDSGMSSLGFLWALRSLSVPGVMGCERYFAVPAPETTGASPEPCSLDSGFPVGSCDLVACSISHEPDVLNVLRTFAAAGLPLKAADRGPDAPFTLAGGPLTRSNPEPLTPFFDAVVTGDGERAMSLLRDAVSAGARTRGQLGEALIGLPELAGVPYHAPASSLPVVSTISTPEAALGDMTLVEVSRGCPKSCTFCIGARANGPLRLADIGTIPGRLPADTRGLGIIGAAVSYHPGLEDLLEHAASRGIRAGISSLRADRIDRNVARLLAATGAEVLTVAADGPSQAARDRIRKDVDEEQLVAAASLAREAGLHAMKVYVMVGLPDESDADIEELAATANRLHRILPAVLSLSVFVPKRNTPLATAPFGPVDAVTRRLALLRKRLSGGVRTNAVSAKEALVEYLVSHATAADADRLVRLSSTLGRYQDWVREFA